MTLADQLWGVVWACEAFWALRLWWLGLSRQYRWLMIYLVYSSAQSLVSSAIIFIPGWESTSYAWMWSTTQPLLWALMLLILVESYGHLIGLERIGPRSSVGLLLIVSMVMLIWFVFSDSILPVNFWVRSESHILLLLAAAGFGLFALGCVSRIDAPANDLYVFIIFGLVCLSQVGLLALKDVVGWNGVKALRYELMPGFYGGLMLIGGLASRRQGDSVPLGPGLKSST